MNPNTPSPREALEAQVTALLLGELPAAEAFALGRAIEQDPELAKLYSHLEKTIGLVRETALSETEQPTAESKSLKLNDDRREKLLAHFKTVEPKEFAEPQRARVSWLVPIAAAAIILLLITISVPNFVKSRTTGQSNAIINNLRQIDGAKQQWALEKNKSADDQPTMADLAPYLRRGPAPIAGETYNVGKMGEPVSADLPTPKQSKWFNSRQSEASESISGRRIELPGPTEVALADNHTLSVVAGAQLEEERAKQVTRTLSQAPAVSTAAIQNGRIDSGPQRERLIEQNVQNLSQSQKDGKPIPAQAPGQQTDFLTRDSERSLPSKLATATIALPYAPKDASGGFTNAPAWVGVLENPGAEPPLALPKATANILAAAPPVSAGTAGGVVLPALADVNTGSKDDSGGLKYSFPQRQLTEVEALKAPAEIDKTASLALVPNSSAGKTNQRLAEARDKEMFGKEISRGYEITGKSNLDAGQFVPKSETASFQARSATVPELADVPLLGKNFNGEPKPTQSRTFGIDGYRGDELVRKQAEAQKESLVAPSSNQSFAYYLDVDAVRSKREQTNVYSVNAVGYSTFTNASSVTLPSQTLDSSTRPVLQYEPLNLEREARFKEALKNRDVGTRNSLAANGKDWPTPPTPQPLPTLNNTSLAKDYSAASPSTPARKLREPLLAAQESEPKQRLIPSNDEVGKAEMSRAYSDAKQDLEKLLRFRSVLNSNIAAEKIDVDIPKTSMVDIIDPATPGSTQNPGFFEKIRRTASGGVERTARVRVEREQSDISGMTEKPSSGNYDPYFLQTEFEVIQSKEVLGKVIDDLKLNEVWAKKYGGGANLNKEETLQLLKKKLDLRAVHGASLEIGAKGDNPDEAAKLANAVAQSYKNHLLERRLAGRAQSLKEGSKAIEKKVATAQKKVDDLRSTLQIQDSQTDQLATDSSDQARSREPKAPAAEPQPEIQTSENAFSTFSLNVSDVSFKLAAASLEKGQMPEPASVRSEEFINAFDYRDPEPAAGVPVAFAWERARYPFAHNRDLLRFSIKTAAAGRQAGRPLNIVLLLDNSGSMERADRVRIRNEALRVLAGQLQPQDRVSMVTFARTARLCVDGVSGNEAARAMEEVSGLSPQGGTNLEEAMNLAYQTAARHYLANGINRVVLLTDGAANLGDVAPESLKQKVETQRKQGIALDCFGIGWEGFNDDLLEVLSRNGDGRYGFINTPEEAASEFAGQLAGALQVAASDVKVQVEFNPKRVTAYRQLGYAKHQLTKEQFRDNTVDAAEIGAAESGNALYVIESNAAGEGPIAVLRVRYKIPGTTDYREQEWTVPFTGNAVALEQANPTMRLAATASAFSEWLVSSPYAAEVTPDRLLGYLTGVPEMFGADARPKKLESMIRQAKSVAGK